jgi:hypothetical protein
MVHHRVVVGVARMNIMRGTVFVFQVRCVRTVFMELDVSGVKFVVFHKSPY